MQGESFVFLVGGKFIYLTWNVVYSVCIQFCFPSGRKVYSSRREDNAVNEEDPERDRAAQV